MKTLRTLAILTFLMISMITKAQNCLVLEKTGSPKRVKYTIGDQFRFKVYNNDTIYDEQISAIFDTAVAFGNKLVQFNSIDKVWTGKESFWASRLRWYSGTAGILFFSIDSFNRLVNRDSPVISKTGMIVLGSGLGLSAIMSLGKNRWFKLNKRHIIKHVDMTIG